MATRIANKVGEDIRDQLEKNLNKEDMEEKKQKLDDLVGLYSSAQITYKEFDKELKALYTKQWEEDKPVLKPFNLEEAKEGKPVCTRDGRKARIICWDIEYRDNPIAAAVFMGECETVYLYTDKGEYNKGEEDELDLMMLSEKKEGWVNVYKERIYDTKEEAIEATYDGVTYIDTIKINWEG